MPVRAKAVGGLWVDCEVTLASENGKSLALKADQTLVPGEGFAIDREHHWIVFLFLREGENWREITSGHVCELERKE